MRQSPVETDTQQHRWFAVGQSNDRDARTAGDAAAAAALQGDEAQLLVVFCSHTHDLDALLDAINRRSGGVPLIGCSTAGEISTGGPGHAGVVVTALGGPGFSARTASAEIRGDDLRGAGAEVARCVADCPERGDHVLLLLTDGLAGDQQEVVRGAYGVVGAGTPLVGGCAGDELEMRLTYQLHNGSVLTHSVVGAALSSDGALGIGVRHGWRRVGEPVLVTRSAHNRVYRLNDRPALDIYFEHLHPPAEARHDQAAFTRFALTHPLGLPRRRGEDHVRFVGEADFGDGSLGLIAEVPQGGLAWFMEGDEDSVLAATDAACADALAPLQGSPPLGAIAFDCIARRGILGDAGIAAEVDRVSHSTGGAPVSGFYTYGEIARTAGQSGFHNQTLVVLALG